MVSATSRLRASGSSRRTIWLVDLVQIGRLAIGRRRAREGEQVGDELADALDLLERQLAEARAELLVVEAFRQELDEGADRDERIPDLVRDARRQRAERRQPVGPLEQHPRMLEIGRQARVLEDRAGAVRELAGEGVVGGVERLVVHTPEQEMPRHASVRFDGKIGAPGTTRRHAVGRDRLGGHGAMPPHASHRASGPVVDQEEDTVQVERPDQQCDERVDDLRAFRQRPGRCRARARCHLPTFSQPPLVLPREPTNRGCANLSAL